MNQISKNYNKKKESFIYKLKMIKQEVAPSLMEFFTIQDIKTMKEKSWWTAC